jgi:pimeloyl-ACP methyl ester carboxylesterase
MGEVAFDYSNVMPSPEVDRPPSAMVLYSLLTFAPQLAEDWMDQTAARKASGASQVQELRGPGPRCKGSKWDGKPRLRTAESSVYTLRRLLLDSFAQPAPESRRFDIPAMIVRGNCDFIPAIVAERYQQAYPKARLVTVAGAGHSLLDHEATFVTDSAIFAAQDLSGVP